jgi:hypothetical protein
LLSGDWAFIGGKYTVSRIIGDGYYTASITPATNPVIESTGYAALPAILASGPGPMVASVGLQEFTAGKQFVSRSVRVTTGSSALFARGMAARGQIDLKGNNIETDSFDSANPLYSTNGQYTVSKRKDNGDVVTNSGLTNSLSVGNADVYGRVATGPGGSVTSGPNGVVGSKAWIAAGNKGIQPGYLTDDMNIEFPAVQQPFSTASAPGPVWYYDGTNWTYYDYGIGSGNYQLTSLNMSGNQKLLVYGKGRLLVNGTVDITGNAFIEILPNQSLQMYGGVNPNTSVNLGGNGVINRTGNAMKFQYYGLPNNTSLAFGGNAAFVGVIYAPNANFTLGGGGSTTYDFVGAAMTKTVTMNGHFKFHYDENLRLVGPRGNYVITSWDEI